MLATISSAYIVVTNILAIYWNYVLKFVYRPSKCVFYPQQTFITFHRYTIQLRKPIKSEDGITDVFRCLWG